MHCFTGSNDFAKKLLDLNFYISISGIITFKNSKELVETVWEPSKAIRKLASVEFKTLGSAPIETPITMNEVKDAYDKCYSTQLPLEREAVAITDYNADTYSDAQIEEGDDLPW